MTIAQAFADCCVDARSSREDAQDGKAAKLRRPLCPGPPKTLPPNALEFVMSKSISYRIAVCLTACLLATSAGLSRRVHAQAPADYFPTSNWRTSAPQDQQLNKKILKRLLKRIRRNEISGIDSLLITRNGYLVTEEYFHGWGPDDLHTLQSDSKSVTSLLVGIAVGQGKISSID